MRILFITSNRIGDAVLTTGVLRWLVDTYPQAKFTLVASPLAADLFRAVPRTERFILLAKKKHHAHWIDLWLQCVGTKWDVIVDFRNSLVTRLLPAHKKYFILKNKGEHKVLDNSRMVGSATPLDPHIYFDLKAIDRASLLMEKAPATMIALGPSANWFAKQWPIEYYTELARRLISTEHDLPRAKLMIAAAPHEMQQVQPLFDALPDEAVINLIGEDLSTIAACFARATLYIGNDSGLTHLAAAAGTQTIGLFGPGFEKVYGPWGRNNIVLRTPESAAELIARLPSDKTAPVPNLMRGLSVDTVFDEVSKILINR